MSLLLSTQSIDPAVTGCSLAEYQGPLGPVSIPELLVQKIWLRREYQTERLVTLSGRQLLVCHPGSWNRLGGPDFRDAELELDGQRVRGDVEVHFRLGDWRAHGHDADPAYNRVVLHVLVFDPGLGAPAARTHAGTVPDSLLLTPYLWEDLESYALRDAVRALEGDDVLDLAAPLLAQPLAERRAWLELKARERWQQRLQFARQRLLQGWEGACHEASLEVLGYRRNRVPMLRLAQRYSLPRLRQTPLQAEQLYRETGVVWNLRGLRPANHPLRRLRQYLELVRLQPHWPESLRVVARAWLESLSVHPAGRRDLHLAAGEKALASIFTPALNGTRLRTLWLDALLPLLAEDQGIPDVCFPRWFAARPGDYPKALEGLLRITELHPCRAHPLSHGLLQGALKLLIEQGRY